MSLLKQNPIKLVESSFKQNTEMDSFADELQAELRKIFPKSNLHIRYQDSWDPIMLIDFTLGADTSEFEKGIENNDPARHLFFIKGFDKETHEILEPLTLDMSYGGFYLTNPPKNISSDMKTYRKINRTMDREFISFKKTVGDKNKIKKYLVDYFTKLKTELKKNVDNIYKSPKINIDYASKL